uniref:Uncharacterized protein n=1 Tax=Rhizophora mucronata TaxID=61149 RepID=A0A2P2Q4T5_RHIMU
MIFGSPLRFTIRYLNSILVMNSFKSEKTWLLTFCKFNRLEFCFEGIDRMY